MRLALAQMNAVMGDIVGNVDRIRAALDRSSRAGAHLTLFPEMAITGYPPEDLLGKDHFVADNLAALTTIAAACTSTDALIGFIDRTDAGLHDAVALCSGGVVERVYHKRVLPSSGVFDEERYFEPGTIATVVNVAGVQVALTLCEDLWVDDVAREAARDTGMIANLSASAFHAGKCHDREAMLCRRAVEGGVWLAYCNLVGGQDELVFDGRSVVISPEGVVVARGAAFDEDLVVVDVPHGGGPALPVPPLLAGPEEVYRALCLGLRDYVCKNGFTDVVLGLSGGIDSSLAAAVAVDALGAGRVHGVTMPSRYSSVGSVTDSRELASNLGIDLREISIEPAFCAMIETVEHGLGELPSGVTEENLQARIRGTLLMALSNTYGWLVLAAGNKSELSVGYSTLYGDMVGGFAPLKDVFKTRVWELARWRNREGDVIPAAIIEKPPSAELRPNQTDQDTLPPYTMLDAILEGYVEGDLSREQLADEGHDPATVDRVCRMVDAAEYKRRQGPLGIRVTPRAFGEDRRMPVTNRYRG